MNVAAKILISLSAYKLTDCSKFSDKDAKELQDYHQDRMQYMANARLRRIRRGQETAP